MANTQLERKRHCLNSISCEKNLISVNPKINIYQQRDEAAKKLIGAVDRCCPKCGTGLPTVLDKSNHTWSSVLHFQWHLLRGTLKT